MRSTLHHLRRPTAGMPMSGAKLSTARLKLPSNSSVAPPHSATSIASMRRCHQSPCTRLSAISRRSTHTLLPTASIPKLSTRRSYSTTSFNHDDVIHTIPNPRKFTGTRGDYGWVSDNAGVVKSRDQQTIDEAIESLHKKFGTEIAVVTLVSLPTSNSEEYRAFATRLFNKWGIGNAVRDTGVLILLLRENRRFEVVTGTGLSTVVPPSWLADFQTTELEFPLTQGDYSTALAKTVLAIADKIETSERNWRISQPKRKEEARSEPGFFGSLSQLGVILALLGALLYYTWQEEAKNDETRKCKFCGGEVQRDTSRILSLTDAQALEVALNAARYEVGSCRGCRRTQNVRHLAFARGQVRCCDYCHYYTAIETESFVVDDKAQKRTRILRQDCQHCRLSSFKEEPVAYLASSDDSSSTVSNGFGGGSSQGGGSGRSF